MLFFTLCLNLCSETSKLMLSLCLTGLLSDIIDVFDFAPGVHTATITVTDTLGSSDSESFDFITPGQYSGTVVHEA